MLEIEKWAKGKPIYIAIGAPQLAILVSNSFHILSLAKNNDLVIKGIKKPSPKEWISFYYRRKYLTNWFFSKANEIGNDFELLIQFINFIESDTSIEEKQKIAASIDKKTIEKAYKANFDEIKSNLPNSETKEDPYLNNDSIKQPELLFLLKILIPCVFLYGELPSILLKNARSGNTEALDKLLHLDKSIIRDPRINSHFHQASFDKNKSTLERLTVALNRNISEKVAMKKAKYKMAGLISLLAEKFDFMLSAPEIKKLFDAVAVDSGIDELIDPDLPVSDEAFYKAVQRERNFWKTIF